MYKAIDSLGAEHYWVVSDSKPKFSDTSIKIVVLWAYDAELKHISSRFKNIPMVRGNFCFWKDEFAQFIFDNL